MKKSKKALALALAAMMAVSAFAGCGGDTTTADTTTTTQATTTKSSGGSSDATTQATTTQAAPTESAYELSIMVPYGDHAYDELPEVIEWRNKLETYTNTKITWELYSSDAYYEKLTLKYASGELTTIMVTDQNAEFMSACKYNTFWDITDYLDLYDNLTTIPETTRLNASNNGKLYGVPRSRDLGRNACGYRQDWADYLGLAHPETIEDLYDMAVEFTIGDPDQNGANDTYGFGLDSWAGQWDIMFPWFGVHNVWGFDANGNLEYYATQPEFKTALKEFRKWNSEGLINEGWQDLGAGAAEKSIFRNNMAGIEVQVADSTRKTWDHLVNNGFPDAKFTYFGAVDAGYGYRVQPTAGYAGYVAVTKANTPTEDDLMKALQFLNDLNDAEMRNLVDWGLEGKNYYLDANGYGVRYTTEEKEAMGVSTASYTSGYNQMVPYFSNAEETAKLVATDSSTLSDGRKAEAAIKADNLNYVLPNYGAGFTSAKYVEVGKDLDDHIEALIKDYILGNIDETALDAGLEQWYEMGGQTYIDEINAAYQASKN